MSVRLSVHHVTEYTYDAQHRRTGERAITPPGATEVWKAAAKRIGRSAGPIS